MLLGFSPRLVLGFVLLPRWCTCLWHISAWTSSVACCEFYSPRSSLFVYSFSNLLFSSVKAFQCQEIFAWSVLISAREHSWKTLVLISWLLGKSLSWKISDDQFLSSVRTQNVWFSRLLYRISVFRGPSHLNFQDGCCEEIGSMYAVHIKVVILGSALVIPRTSCP